MVVVDHFLGIIVVCIDTWVAAAAALLRDGAAGGGEHFGLRCGWPYSRRWMGLSEWVRWSQLYSICRFKPPGDEIIIQVEGFNNASKKKLRIFFLFTLILSFAGKKIHQVQQYSI